ncbi:hypothetical protein F5146DRAFT_773057 [Armillaria mellea]|nr:hypothetical protein F5146DRAFT_773057 [Armillaria mellea]
MKVRNRLWFVSFSRVILLLSQQVPGVNTRSAAVPYFIKLLVPLPVFLALAPSSCFSLSSKLTPFRYVVVCQQQQLDSEPTRN